MKRAKQQLRDAADAKLSRLVRIRDGHQCYCGSRQNITAGHVIPRGNTSLRWNLLNVHAQCSSCNYRHNWDTAPYLRWFTRRFGTDALGKLLEADEGTKLTQLKTPELQEIYDEISRLYELQQTLAVWTDQLLIKNGFYGDLLKGKRKLGPPLLERRHLID